MYKKPIILINAYLYQVYLESKRRGYKFNKTKIKPLKIKERITVTKGQLEFSYLLKKLKKRDKKRFKELRSLKFNIESNPIFKVVNGGVERWEK